MPLVVEAEARVTGAHVVPVPVDAVQTGIVTGYVTVGEVGGAQVESAVQDSTGRVPAVADADEPFTVRCVGENWVGCFSAAENAVVEAVTVHPSPEPEASTALIVARPSSLMSKPFSVACGHATVEGPAIARVPAATVAVPFIVQDDPTMVRSTLGVHVVEEAAEVRIATGPTASTPAATTPAATSRPRRFADHLGTRSFDTHPPPVTGP